MQTITFNIEKGGVGKTTLACHLAWHLAEQGDRVAFLDFDQQSNGSDTLTKYEAPAKGANEGATNGFERAGEIEALLHDGFVVPAGTAHVYAGAGALHRFTTDYVPALRALEANMATLRASYDYCIIDTAPGWSWINFAALMVTDHLIVPLQLEQFAVDGLQRISDSIRTVEEQARGGRPINFLGIVPNNFRLDNRLHVANLKALKGAIGGFLFDAMVPHRQHIAEAMQRGVPVWRMKKDTRDATAHMNAVLAELAKRLKKAPKREGAA